MVTTAEMLGTGYGGNGSLGTLSPEAQSLIYGPSGPFGNPYGLQGAYGGYQQGMPMTNLLVPSTLGQPVQQPMMQIPFDNYYGVNPNGPPSGFIQNTSPQANATTSATGNAGAGSTIPGATPGGGPTQAGGAGSAPVGPYPGTPFSSEWGTAVNNAAAASSNPIWFASNAIGAALHPTTPSTAGTTAPTTSSITPTVPVTAPVTPAPPVTPPPPTTPPKKPVPVPGSGGGGGSTAAPVQQPGYNSYGFYTLNG